MKAMHLFVIVLMLLIGSIMIMFHLENENQNQQAKIQELINELEVSRCTIDMQNNQDIVCD